MTGLWAALVVYLAGLASYGWEHQEAVTAVQADPVAVLESEQYVFPPVFEYLQGLEPIAPPVPVEQWYAAAAGLVVLTLLAIVVVRFRRAGGPSGPPTTMETTALTLSVAVAAGVVGGPLLVGTALLPLLFGVVVWHTRCGPGWSPSFVFVLPLLGPAVGLATGWLGYATPQLELAAFVAVPLLGGLALPLRASIRKRVGW